MLVPFSSTGNALNQTKTARLFIVTWFISNYSAQELRCFFFNTLCYFSITEPGNFEISFLHFMLLQYHGAQEF